MLGPSAILAPAPLSPVLGQHSLPYFSAPIFAPYRRQLISASFGTTAGNAAYAHAQGNPVTIEAVTTNRQRICQTLGIPFLSLFPPNLTRGKEEQVIAITATDLDTLNAIPRPQRVEAHGVITATRGLALMMNTADCSATTLFDPVKQVVGLVHTGYQGAMARTLPRTVALMSSRFGSRPADILAGLSPSICADHFTQKNPVQRNLPNWQPYLQPAPNGETAVNLRGYLVAQMLECGLQAHHIDNSAPCSYSAKLPNGAYAYFSHHRDRTGDRMATVATLV